MYTVRKIPLINAFLYTAYQYHVYWTQNANNKKYNKVYGEHAFITYYLLYAILSPCIYNVSHFSTAYVHFEL